jgi:hypothetical protein
VRRSLFLIVALLMFPTAVALAAFGEPEVADPTFFVSDTAPDQLQVDAAGHAYFASIVDEPVGNDGDTDRQVIVYERCGTSWKEEIRGGMLDDGSYSTRPIALEVAPSGDALGVWLDGTSSEQTIYTSFRPADGGWSAPEAVDTLPVSRVLTDIAPNGDAVIAYVEDTGTIGAVPLKVAVRTKADGTWAKDELDDIDALQAVAMSPDADAIVLTSDGQQFGAFHSFFRPRGGSWGGKEDVDDVIQTVVSVAIAFGPDGKAVFGAAQPDIGSENDRVMTAVRGAGPGGTWSNLAELSEVDNSAGFVYGLDAATHPGGVVLGWIERQTGAFLDDLGVARYNGTSFEAPKIYSVDDFFGTVSVGATPGGRAIVAAQHQTPADRNRVMVAEASGIGGPWGEIEEIPAPPGDHRDPRVGAGGIVAVAYGVHGTDQRSEVVADGPSPSCDGSTPTATATATGTATATAGPNPQPPPPPPPALEDVVAPKGKLQKVAFKGGKLRITLKLDEAAAVTFKVDGKALAKKKLKAGTRKLALKPKKKLERGRHTLTAKAVDASGNRAKTLKKRFRVK